MPVISDAADFHVEDLYLDLQAFSSHRFFLKCEGFNFAGSIKLKAATQMVTDAEREGRLRPGSLLVESSSGNLGIALALIAASRGYRFLCVTDPRCNLAAIRMMQALGGEVRTITEPDEVGGYLAARLRYVRELCAGDSRYVWLDQYTNANNWQAHYQRTAPAISQAFPDLDVLFVGAGTTGTLMGCARYFRDWHRRVRVIAIDAVGSVAFGGQPGLRMIPGLGTSVRPPMLDESYLDGVVHVGERATAQACHALAARGFLLGGSSGTVVSGALSWLAENDPAREFTSVAISPDLGERYLDSLYEDDWLRDAFGQAEGEKSTLSSLRT